MTAQRRKLQVNVKKKFERKLKEKKNITRMVQLIKEVENKKRRKLEVKEKTTKESFKNG